MANISIEDDKIIISLSFKEKFFSIKYSRIEISKGDIDRFEYGAPGFKLRLKGFSAGSRAIGLFLTSNNKKAFALLNGGDRVITIWLRNGPYDAIVIDNKNKGFDKLESLIS